MKKHIKHIKTEGPKDLLESFFFLDGLTCPKINNLKIFCLPQKLLSLKLQETFLIYFFQKETKMRVWTPSIFFQNLKLWKTTFFQNNKSSPPSDFQGVFFLFKTIKTPPSRGLLSGRRWWATWRGWLTIWRKRSWTRSQAGFQRRSKKIVFQKTFQEAKGAVFESGLDKGCWVVWISGVDGF